MPKKCITGKLINCTSVPGLVQASCYMFLENALIAHHTPAKTQGNFVL